MNHRRIAIVGMAVFLGAIAAPAAFAQTFQNYRCADGTRFIVGFFQSDSRAHLQLGGKALTLARRLAFYGSRYSGGGVTLKVGKAGFATLRRAKRPATACDLT